MIEIRNMLHQLMDVVDDEEEDTSTHEIEQEDGSINAGEPYQMQTTMEQEDDDDNCTDDYMAMEVRKGGAVIKVPEWVSNIFRFPERQSYFALATFASKVMSDYYISLLIIFLTDVLKMGLIQGAIITNLRDGSSRASAIFVAYFTDVYLGHFLMLFLSALLNSLGFGILHSLYPKLTEVHITMMFYFALSLITIGIPGIEFSLGGFKPKEKKTSPKKLIEFGLGNQRKCYCCPRFKIHWKWLFTMQRQWQICYLTGVIISLLVLPLLSNEWSMNFLMLALMMGSSLIFLLLANLFYTPKKPYGSLRQYLSSFKAASMSKKRFKSDDQNVMARDMENYSRKTDYEPHGHSHEVSSTGNGINTKDGNHLIRRTTSLQSRSLQKATSIETKSNTDPTTQQEGPSSRQNPPIKKRSIHRTLQQVEDIKVLIRILPMSISFIVFGMVIAVGDTFFLEQASNMYNPELGLLTLFNFQFLVLASKIGKYGTAAAYDIIANKIGVAKKRGCDATKVGLAMVLSILCCATASAVEAERLRLIDKKHLLELDEYTVPMNVYWLIPQFFFVGAMQKVASDGIEGFFSYQTTPKTKRYAGTVADSMTGVGVLLSIPIFLFIRKVFGWIENDIDRGRLDNFYSLLAVLSAVNFLLFVVIALRYMYWKRKPEKDEQTENQSFGVSQVHPSTASPLSSPTSLSHSPLQRPLPVATAMPPKDLGAGVSSGDSSSPSSSPASTSSSKKWRGDEKEAAKKGSITVHDIEMGVVGGTSEDANKHIPPISLEEEPEAQSQEVEEKIKQAQKETSSTSCKNST